MATDYSTPGDDHQKDIRDRYEAASSDWKPIRDEGRLDVRALTPKGTWTDADRTARELAGRPCLHLDELTQHVNQLINDVKAAKRAIEVNPEGYHTNDAKAQFYGNLIRQIEYRSNSQHAYTSMFEDAVQRSYGFARIVSRYTRNRISAKPTFRDFEQELRIVAIENPDIITPEPYWKSPTLKGIEYLFAEEQFTHAEFRQRFGKKAKTTSFSSEHIREVGERWIDDDRVNVAEYWCVKTRPKTLVLLPGPTEDDPTGTRNPLAFWKDTISEEQWATVKARVLREREVDNPYVMQEFTNGLETLEEPTEWPGEHIPFVGCFGKVLWVNEGGKSKRQILSLIRLARDPQQLFDYYRSTEAELVGMTPKFPYFSYKGQLENKEKLLIAKSLHEPVAVIEVNPVTDTARGTILPFPQRQPYDPPIQAFSIGAEEARRSIQSSTGVGFLPTQAQRQNEKSGIALQQIQTSAQKGSYHFIDHYEGSLIFLGELLHAAIPHFYDTARDVHVRKSNDESLPVRINDPTAQPNDEYGENIMLTPEDDGAITLSTGPGFDSERAEAKDFVKQLSGNPEVFRLVGDILVKLQGQGPVWDELAERLHALLPPELRQDKEGQPDPAVLMQQLQQGKQLVEAMQQRIRELEQEIATDSVKAQRDLAIAQLKGQLDKAMKVLDGTIKMKLQDDQQAHEMALKGAEAADARDQARMQADEQRRLGRQSAALSGSGSKPIGKPH